MAQGDFEFFDQALVDMAEGLHDFELDTFKIFLTDGATYTEAGTPMTVTLADPRYGAGGTTNLTTEEADQVGAYAGPVTLTNPTVSLVGGSAEIDWDDPAPWSQNGSSPTAVHYAVIYNDDASTYRCVGFVDLGGAFDMTTGDLTITFNATAAADLDQA